MYNYVLIEYLFLINLINSEIILNEKLFQNNQGICKEILINELNYCENEIKNFIHYYDIFNSNLQYNKHFDLFFNLNEKQFNFFLNIKKNFLFNNETFFIKNISLLNNNQYTLNNLMEKKNNYQFNNNFIIKNINKNYYLNFFKNNYFNLTNIINFIFNIDIIKLIENKKNINIVSDINLINLKSYKNINKNLINKFNPIKYNNEKIYIKFYKNLNYLDYLNLNSNNLDLVKNHFIILTNLYTTEYNFKILLNFLKKDSYKEFYLKLPINYVTSNFHHKMYFSYYSPGIDYYLNNLLFDKIIYNQNGNNLTESLIFIKKKINTSPLIFNYKFKNKFDYFINTKYNINISNLKNYNLDYFNVSKTKKITHTFLGIDYFYNGRGNIRSEIARANVLIGHYLPRVRPFLLKGSETRQQLLDKVGYRILVQNSDQINITSRINYNHYLYGYFKGGFVSLANFTQIDMFHNNCDLFFFKGNTFNKQHHSISILNKILPVIKVDNRLGMRRIRNIEKKTKLGVFSNNFFIQNTKYERALNLMFNFNEELKPNNTFKEYICNLLFGFIKDNNTTYITFKDHYNKNNFIGKHILYRINNYDYHKNRKYHIFYNELLNILNKDAWQKLNYYTFLELSKKPIYLHTKNYEIFPNFRAWPISKDFNKNFYRKAGYTKNYRQVLHFYGFVSNQNKEGYSRFLKTGLYTQSIYNKYFNFIPFLYYINRFDYLKKSIDYTKRHDFISFIPQFKIFNIKIFNSIQSFDYFDNHNPALIKFTNNLYFNNTQKLDQSIYNLNNFNNKIINYIPDIFYEKYATLEWNNQLFFKILNRKLLYKHLISFGDLSNNYIQNIIYNYAKIIFFEEKLRHIFFNRNIFKYKNFENLNDFITFKQNNLLIKKIEKIKINKNKNFNLLDDLENIIKIFKNSNSHVIKMSNIFYKQYFFDDLVNQYNSRKEYFFYNFADRFFGPTFGRKGISKDHTITYKGVKIPISYHLFLKIKFIMFHITYMRYPEIYEAYRNVEQMGMSFTKKNEMFEYIFRFYCTDLKKFYNVPPYYMSGESSFKFLLVSKDITQFKKTSNIFFELYKLNKLYIEHFIIGDQKPIDNLYDENNKPIDLKFKNIFYKDLYNFFKEYHQLYNYVIDSFEYYNNLKIEDKFTESHPFFDISFEYLLNLLTGKLFYRTLKFYSFFFKYHMFDFKYRVMDLSYNDDIIGPKPKFREHSFKSDYNNINYLLCRIPFKYFATIMKNNIVDTNFFFNKFFSFMLIYNLKLLNKFQILDNYINKMDYNINFINFFNSEIKINKINLIKKNTSINFKLYKNKLIEEAGLYNINIINNSNKISDEDYFLLYNRKRLDNESIYKSWHSTKFLNKKIHYYQNHNLFDLEKNLNFFYKKYIFYITRFKNYKIIFNLNMLNSSLCNYFNTDLEYNRLIFHTINASSYSRNLNFTYPQNNIKNINIFSFLSYRKDKIGYSESDRYLRNMKPNHFYLKKTVDLISHEFFYYRKERLQKHLWPYGMKTHCYNRTLAKYKVDYRTYRIRKKLRRNEPGRHNPYYDIYMSRDYTFPIEGIAPLKTNLISLKKLINVNKHDKFKNLSYFQYYGDTRFPKKKINYKKLNFIFNIYNFQSYFINDRYFFENKNLFTIKQFYNHRTTSDYLRNLINYKKKNMSRDFYNNSKKYNINDLKMIDPYYNLYNLYTPIKIWEIKLSTKLFPYFYSKNLNLNYNIVQSQRLTTVAEHHYAKLGASRKFRLKKKFLIFEFLKSYQYAISKHKYLNIEKKKYFFDYFINTFLQKNNFEAKIKNKFFVTSVGNLLANEYIYNNYLIKKDFFFYNKNYVKNFKVILNKKNLNKSYIYSNNKNNDKYPYIFDYKMFFDHTDKNFNQKIFIQNSLKVFKYCILNNFYIKLPYISTFATKTIIDYFNEYNNNTHKFLKLRTMFPHFWRYRQRFYNRKFAAEMRAISIFPWFVSDFFFLNWRNVITAFKSFFLKFNETLPFNIFMNDPLDINNSFYNYKNNELNLINVMFKNKFFCKFHKTCFFYETQTKIEPLLYRYFRIGKPIDTTIINVNYNNIDYFKYFQKKDINKKNIYISLYKGNIKYLKTNNFFFFSKVFEFNKYILKKKNIFTYSFFKPYDFYIFRYKTSFTSLNNVYYKTNSSQNLRKFMYNLFIYRESHNINFDLFYSFLAKNAEKLLVNDFYLYNIKYRRKLLPIRYSHMKELHHYLKKKTFTVKYYEIISSFNRKKLEELSLFGFLVKNNIIFGIFEYNNLCNYAYNLKYEKFHINNNEYNIYSIKKVLNTIFMLKNKYIWLIFFYYNNLFYFFLFFHHIVIDFIIDPIKYTSYFFYIKIPIIFFVDYKILFIDILLTFYTIFIQFLIILYSWFCISGEGLINLKDYIIFNHNKIDWFLLHEKYNIYPCDVYGRSLFEMKISRIIFIIFYISYLIIYIKLFLLLFFFFSKSYNLFLLNLNRKKKYLFIDNKFDLELNNKIHYYFLNYNKFVKNFNNIKNNFEIIFFFKSKHSYKYYKSKFKCKLKLPYFLDEPSLRRINKLKIVSNFETHYFILDTDLKKFRTTLSFLNSSYALFTKTRTIEIGNLLIKGNIKRIIYIYKLGTTLAYNRILGNFLIPNAMTNLEKNNYYFIDKIFLNNQLKIFNLMPISEDDNYIYLPKFIFTNVIRYRFKYTNVFYTYNFLFFIFFDSLLTIEGTLFRISNPNYFKDLLFLNKTMLAPFFSFFI